MGHIQIGYRYVYQCTLHIYRVYTQDTHTHISAHGGDRCYLLYPRASRDLLKAYPTLPAGQVPPEDDDDFSEYSVYSVEDYQDPEVPWDGDGDSKGWDQRGSGSGT